MVGPDQLFSNMASEKSRPNCNFSGEQSVSLFDYNVENHFKFIDIVAKLCGTPQSDRFKAVIVKHFSSMVTFLTEWNYLNYRPRTIRFTGKGGASPAENIYSEIKLPHFSSAAVPKSEQSAKLLSESCKDFVLFAGGPIWGLDWCPRGSERSDSLITCEFVAVATHPPESSYHRIGASVTGRGVIQIWCILDVVEEEEVFEAAQPVKRRGRPRKNLLGGAGLIMKSKRGSQEKPKGRHKRTQFCRNELLLRSEIVSPDSVEFPETFQSIDLNQHMIDPCLDVYDNFSVRNGEACTHDKSLEITQRTFEAKKISGVKTPSSNDDGILSRQIMLIDGQEASAKFLLANSRAVEEDESSGKMQDFCSLECDVGGLSVPRDFLFPRVILCLAHNGKVVWDVKWRPYNEYDSERNLRMGYLAVLLGDGSLEVWEVPSPETVRLLYSSHSDGTDPRFIKLEPVFRCSKLTCGDRQSMPLTLEWSTFSPHEFILGGCHDGTVALWRFTAQKFLTDTRPLLCFNAGTSPIRTIAWSPHEKSDRESANVIVTAGHEGLKFWDIRDPFRPLWCVSLARKGVNSLDWLSTPRCLLLALDDGTLRILSLAKAAYDVPVTGAPFIGTQQQGLSSYCCSSFSIWSVHASPKSGIVAYCNADGSALHFQLTNRAVEKDPLRNRAPHFLFGSLTEDGPALTVNSWLSDTPFPMKRSIDEWGDTPRTLKGFTYDSNQVKRSRKQKFVHPNSEDQLLVLTYGGNVESESEHVQTHKSKSSKRKSSKKDLALVCMDEGLEDSQVLENGDRTAESGAEAFPPKIVAMHRIRWNMNKGSERWLCCGGAAGILRCQKIPLPVNYKKTSTRKDT